MNVTETREAYRIDPDESAVEALIRAFRSTVGPVDDDGTVLADHRDPDALGRLVETAADVEVATIRWGHTVSIDGDAVRLEAD
jgi:hypothetical protein